MKHTTKGLQGFAHRRTGFTLIEVLLAVSLAAFVLAGASAFLVNVSNAWTLRDDRVFLEEHVAGVSTFLRTSFEQSGARAQLNGNGGGGGGTSPQPNNNNAQTPPGAGNTPQVRVNAPNQNRPNPANSGNTNVSTDSDANPRGVTWQALPGASPEDDPRLTVLFAEGPPALVSALPAEQSVRAFLAFEPERGLLLRWYSALHEEEPEREDQLVETLISPWVTGLEYMTYDPERELWETTTEPYLDENRDPITPSFIRLTFQRDGTLAEAHVAVPPVSEGIPLY